MIEQNTVLPEAVSYWEDALMVRKTESVIRLSRYVGSRHEIGYISIHAKVIWYPHFFLMSLAYIESAGITKCFWFPTTRIHTVWMRAKARPCAVKCKCRNIILRFVFFLSLSFSLSFLLSFLIILVPLPLRSPQYDWHLRLFLFVSIVVSCPSSSPSTGLPSVRYVIEILSAWTGRNE